MSQRFLLTCSCGTSQPVATTQAGQSVPCSCGRNLEVPMLRVLKRLPPAEPTTAGPVRPTVEISISRVLFVLAVIATVLVAGYTLLNYMAISHIRVGRSPEQMIAEDQTSVDAFMPDQLLREWNKLNKEGLGMRAPTPEMMAHLMRAALQEQVSDGLITCGILFGACLLLGAFAARSRRRNPKK
jgi:hypothetical protein